MELTPEQKERLEELQAIDTLTPAEAEELAQLEAIPTSEEEEDFDAEWDKLENDGKPSDSDDEEGEEEQNESSDDEDADAEDGDGDESTRGDESDNSDSGTGQTPDPRDEKIAAMEQKMRSWEGRLKAADKRAAEAEAKLKAMEDGQTKAKASSDTNASLDIDDDPELSEFFAEFPDLKGPFMKLAGKVAENIISDKLGDVDDVRSELKSVKDTVQEDSDRKHVEAITTAHPDWQDIYNSGKLEQWIQSQPSYAQAGLYEIVKAGSTQEVIDMFSDYKRATGTKTKTKTSQRLSDEKKKRAQAMQAVPASTAGPLKPKSMPAKDDFDGAWDHFEKKDRKR